jgi:membrane associated rhomboid family serine protease
MIILPVGHDHTIRRLPWVTIGIMIVCTLIQLHRTIFAPWPKDFDAAERELQDADKSLVVSIIGRVGKPAAPIDVQSGPFHETPDDEPSPADMAPFLAPSADAPTAQMAPLQENDPLVRAIENGETYDQIISEVHAGKLGDDRDAWVKAVHDAQKKLKALEDKDIASRLAYVPADGVVSIKILLAAFAHGGWLHLIGNMVFLWLCGCNLEDRWGRVAFGAFYACAAIAGSLAFMLVHRHDGVGTFGASGAIAGAMGAFLVCFARARIQWMYILYLRPKFFYTPALVSLPIWFVAQALQLVFEVSGMPGIAYSAHVGGFVFGVAFAGGLKLSGLDEKLQKLADDGDDAGWEEHPDYVTALPLVETDPKAAVPLLRKVLVDRPTHEEARLSLAHAAARTSDTSLLGEVLPRAVARLSTEERWADLLPLVQSLEPMLAPAGALAIDERTSAQLLHAACEGGDSKLCLRLARGHQQRFAGGSTMPRVLWDVAMAQRRAGAVPQSQATLQRIVNEFPTHALAAKARQA